MAQITAGDTVGGRYKVERMLGAGGMATVFAAQDLGTPRKVAIKVLNEVLRRHPTIPKRFMQEARAARTLTTHFAVKIEGTGELSDGTPYLVMELLEGVDLAHAARDAGGKLDTERALYLADQIAEALSDAHRHGILHRDLKPDNVFILPTPVGEMVKVMDFGISKILEPGQGAAKITMTGTTVGTPQYMPIEQLRAAKDLDGRVDVYALGVLLYEMLAGLRPFDGFSYEEVIMKVATQTAQPLSAYRNDLPPGLVDTIMRAMAKDRNERIPSMDALRTQLAPFWSQRRPDFRPYVRINSTPPPPAPTMPDTPAPAPTIPDTVSSSPAIAFSQSQSGQAYGPPPGISEGSSAALQRASGSGQIPIGVGASASGPAIRAPIAPKKKSYVGLIVGLVIAGAGLIVVIAVAIAAWMYVQQSDTPTPAPTPKSSPAGSKR